METAYVNQLDSLEPNQRQVTTDNRMSIRTTTKSSQACRISVSDTGVLRKWVRSNADNTAPQDQRITSLPKCHLRMDII